MSDRPYDDIHYLKEDLTNALTRAFADHLRLLDNTTAVLPFNNKVEALIEAFARMTYALLIHQDLTYAQTMTWVHQISQAFVARTIYDIGYSMATNRADFRREHTPGALYGDPNP